MNQNIGLVMLKRDNAYVIKQQLASYLADFKSHQLTVGNDNFRFMEGGQSHAECIVFLHGTVGNKSQWRGLMQLLCKQYRVIAIDMPGLAVGFRSEADHYSLTALSHYLSRFLKHQRVSSACIVGHSMGANVATRFAALYPEKVSSLVLSSLTGWEQLFDQSYWHKFSEFKQLLVFNSSEEFQSVVASLFHQPPYMPKSLLDFRMRDIKKHQSQLFKVLGDIQQEFHLLGSDLKTLKCPVLAINGKNDVFIDMNIIRRAEILLPEIKMVNFPDCGHVPFLEYPKKTHSIIKDFILDVTTELQSA
jgi:pimeloyl-ACP methyl ester carboxylesterase